MFNWLKYFLFKNDLCNFNFTNITWLFDRVMNGVMDEFLADRKRILILEEDVKEIEQELFIYNKDKILDEHNDYWLEHKKKITELTEMLNKLGNYLGCSLKYKPIGKHQLLDKDVDYKQLHVNNLEFYRELDSIINNSNELKVRLVYVSLIKLCNIAKEQDCYCFTIGSTKSKDTQWSVVVTSCKAEFYNKSGIVEVKLNNGHTLDLYKRPITQWFEFLCDLAGVKNGISQ